MNSRKLFATAVLAAAALALSACASASAGNDPSSPAQTFDATFAADSFTLGAPVYVGQDQGFFEDHGVNAETVPFQNGIEGIQALSSGQVDFAFGLDFATISSISDNLVVLGSVASPGAGFHKLYFAPGINKPVDLEGKKIGVAAGTAQEYITNKWLEINGLDGSVEIVALPGVFEMVSALKTGDIQAAFIFGTGEAEAAADPNLTKFSDDSEVITTQGIYVLTTRKLAEDDPAAVEAVLQSLKESTDFMADDISAASQITADAVQGDAAAIEAALSINNPGLGFTQDQLDVLHAIQEFLIGTGKIPADTDIDASLYLDPLREVVGTGVATP